MTHRGVSTVLGYVLIIGIVTLLLTTMVGVFGPLVLQQQTGASHGTLAVFGNDLAGDISTADRLAVAAGPNGSVTVHSHLPEKVGQSPYEIAIRDPPDRVGYELTLQSDQYDGRVLVHINPKTPIDLDEVETLSGGQLTITYQGEKLVIDRA